MIMIIVRAIPIGPSTPGGVYTLNTVTGSRRDSENINRNVSCFRDKQEKRQTADVSSQISRTRATSGSELFLQEGEACWRATAERGSSLENGHQAEILGSGAGGSARSLTDTNWDSPAEPQIDKVGWKYRPQTCANIIRPGAAWCREEGFLEVSF